MKKNVVSALFGEITPEELEKIREKTRELENSVAEFQNRPKYSEEKENNRRV